MEEKKARQWLEAWTRGELSFEELAARWDGQRLRDLGFARVDLERETRQGVAEVVLGEHKTPPQIVAIARALAAAGQNVLVTRVERSKADAVVALEPALRYEEVARLLVLQSRPPEPWSIAPVAVVTAGTSDGPVAEEAARTLELLGLPVRRVSDVGVAGLHRLLAELDVLQSASAVIVVAGMEGALPSVVGGLVRGPVIAVPTSVGYGVAAGGFAALAGMLSSCAAGVTVVNIDNGFGAAMAVVRAFESRRPNPGGDRE